MSGLDSSGIVSQHGADEIAAAAPYTGVNTTVDSSLYNDGQLAGDKESIKDRANSYWAKQQLQQQPKPKQLKLKTLEHAPKAAKPQQKQAGPMGSVGHNFFRPS